ncbi:mas-related G-protein coupled receptor member H-like [Protobothrops mucrosquamatus]|uniref:mas-related G-protein coupled receptor member H-like n=1 Tax=Protobothrops mucrosquamatus TaxID=103944 RepID=UPI0010FB16F6|nr:mas-related G-protein coupled receptor member H-like [Protobothrops mucrosquamatus]
MNATEEYPYYNGIGAFYEDQTERIIPPIILTACCIGLPLNGIVIWLLGFQIKRNPFTVLILNLAISDCGVLIFMPIVSTPYFTDFMPSITHRVFLFCLSDIIYINGLFLLTAISVDRCVSILFPIWHRCFRSKHFSPALCVFLWIISFLLGGIQSLMKYVFLYDVIPRLHLLVTALLCLPLITISSVILFININLRSEQIKRGRLLVMILITLFCFLILSVPLYIYICVDHFVDMSYVWDYLSFPFYFSLSACLNSSINPVIYFLVGRKKGTQSRESIKVMFQRVFGEDEASETR